MLEALKAENPDVVACLGDLGESEAASRWTPENPGELWEQFEESANLLAEVRKVAPRAKEYILLDGNHDDNLRQPHRLPKAIRSLCQPEAYPRLKAELSHWTRVPYENSPKGTRWIGPVLLKHGFQTGGNADRYEAILLSGCRPGSLVIGGHTHRPVEPTQCRVTSKVPLPIWYMNVGTIGPLKPDWASRDNTSEWAHAYGVVEINGDKWKAKLVRKDEWR